MTCEGRCRNNILHSSRKVIQSIYLEIFPKLKCIQFQVQTCVSAGAMEKGEYAPSIKRYQDVNMIMSRLNNMWNNNSGKGQQCGVMPNANTYKFIEETHLIKEEKQQLEQHEARRWKGDTERSKQVIYGLDAGIRRQKRDKHRNNIKNKSKISPRPKTKIKTKIQQKIEWNEMHGINANWPQRISMFLKEARYKTRLNWNYPRK